METRTIGSLEVSVVGVGCNNFGGRIDDAATRAVVGAALDEGITLFDTADVYGAGQSERILGKATRGKRRGRRTRCAAFVRNCRIRGRGIH